MIIFSLQRSVDTLEYLKTELVGIYNIIYISQGDECEKTQLKIQTTRYPLKQMKH